MKRIRISRDNPCALCGKIQEGELHFVIAPSHTEDWCLVGRIGLLCPECSKANNK